MINNPSLFLGTCFLLAMVPGPGAMVVVRQAVRDGRKSAFITLLGNETALIIWGVSAACGLTALITASRTAYAVVRIAGAVILIAIGCQSLARARAGEKPVPAVSSNVNNGWKSYSVGVIANLSNPKAGVFAMSFLPQFVSSRASVFPTILLLASLWAVVDAVWFIGAIWFIEKAKMFFSRVKVWRRMTQISGLVLIGLGVRLAIFGA
jgi:threonine/homoserine/homoserine lactone efflux protein